MSDKEQKEVEALGRRLGREAARHTPSSNQMPERIWSLWIPGYTPMGTLSSLGCFYESHAIDSTEYIRADLVEAKDKRIEELTTALYALANRCEDSAVEFWFENDTHASDALERAKFLVERECQKEESKQ